MLFTRTKQYSDIIPPIDIKKLIFIAKKTLPDVIFNMGSLEGNPFTFPEVQTLLDGITVGGHRVSDEQQIYDLKNSWEYLFEIVKKEEFQLNKEIFNSINNKVAINEALISGEFRDSQVRIGGTDYIPPQAEKLNSIFLNELPKIIDRCKTKTELAFEIFLFVALNQFYYDGNKRTGRLLANGVLLSSGQGVLNIKAKDKLEFNTLMIDFYDTKMLIIFVTFYIVNA